MMIVSERTRSEEVCRYVDGDDLALSDVWNPSSVTQGTSSSPFHLV